MRVLITNDDGVNSPAILGLKQSLEKLFDTVVFAPDHNWSAAGHPKTMHKPLRVHQVTLADGSPASTSNGAPSDCVALALLGLVRPKPDIIVSGINLGANLGYDVFYSGTVAAAIEGIISGIPALAFSREGSEPAEDYAPLANFAAKLTKMVLERPLPPDTLLNVNFPAVPWAQIRGLAITRLGRRVYRDALVSREDPRGIPYYWIGGTPPGGVSDHGTDIWALANNLISITPVNLDMTDREVMDELSRWSIPLNETS